MIDWYETRRRSAACEATYRAVVLQLARFMQEQVLEDFTLHTEPGNHLLIRYVLAPGIQPHQIRLAGMPPGTKVRQPC